jgi:hypothetical protein
MKRTTLHTFLIGASVLMIVSLVVEDIRWSMYAYERWGNIPYPDHIKLTAYFLALLPTVVSIYLKQKSIPVPSMARRLMLGVVQLYLVTAFLGGAFFLLLFSALGLHEYRVEGDVVSAALGLSGALASFLFCYFLWRVRRAFLAS